MNELSPDQLRQLRSDVSCSRKKLRPFRQHRMKMLEQYVGANYSDSGAKDKVPVNMLELAMTIYLRQMAANTPQIMCTTSVPELKVIAENLRLTVNKYAKRMELGKTMRKLVQDALFSIGICKIGIAGDVNVLVDGTVHQSEQPFVDVVDLDDWVHDTAATSWEYCSYMGNRYTVPVEYLMDSGYYDKKAAEDAYNVTKQRKNEGGDSRVESLAHGEGSQTWDEWKKRVDVWDLYLPEEGIVTSFLAESGTEQVLRTVEWKGPRHGMYHSLCFGRVPKSIMPAAPAQALFDMHEIINRLFRKLGRQAEREKTILGVPGGSEKDGQRTVAADDGDAIKMDNPDRMREYRYGGINQTTMAFLMQCGELFNKMGGNLDTIGGLAQSADTLGQEEMIGASSSKMIADMQDTTMIFADDVIKDLSWYIFTNPLLQEQLIKAIPGTEFAVQTLFTSVDIRGAFEDYQFTVKPYSMQHDTPQLRLQAIQGVFNNLIMPLAGQLQAQGLGINFKETLKIIGRYSNIEDDLSSILVPIPPPDPMMGQGGPTQGAAPVTTRRYERVNKGGATTQGKTKAMIGAMLGTNPQPKEMAQIGRPAS